MGANDQLLSCRTHAGNKVVTISAGKISYASDNNSSNYRKIAGKEIILTKNHQRKSFNKIFLHEGKTVIVNIGNMKNHSELEDTLTIRNKLGHELTYSLYCD